jgi:hypothetical protein
MYRITIETDNREKLLQIIQHEDLDLDCGGVHRKKSGEWEIQAYTSPEVTDRLQKYDCKIHIDNQLEERSARRQFEVGKGDRFNGGQVSPHGIGKKR